MFPVCARAPELPLYNDGCYDSSIDMWSAGCVMAELLGMTQPAAVRRSAGSLVLFPGTSSVLGRQSSMGTLSI